MNYFHQDHHVRLTLILSLHQVSSDLPESIFVSTRQAEALRGGGLFLNKPPLFYMQLDWGGGWPPREGATMSPTMIQWSTMVAKTKTHFLSCVAFPYPETAPTEGEQIGPSPGLGQKFLQCANDATRKPSEETRRAVFENLKTLH